MCTRNVLEGPRPSYKRLGGGAFLPKTKNYTSYSLQYEKPTPKMGQFNQTQPEMIVADPKSR